MPADVAPTAVLLRPYAPDDWPRLCAIHDLARLGELRAAGLEAAYLTLAQTAENEGLFDGTVTVAVLDGEVQGFAAVCDGELTWLYVHPAAQRRGIGRALLRRAIDAGALTAEVLVGNAPALQLYLSEGFAIDGRIDGRLAGNARFAASGYRLRRAAG